MIFYGEEKKVESIIRSFSGKDQNKLSSTPDKAIPNTEEINISMSYRYSGENVLGYYYTIGIKGKLFEHNPIGAMTSIGHNTKYLPHMQDVISWQGGTLFFTDDKFKILFKARGVKIYSFKFDEGKWTNYIPYSLDIEAQEILFNGESTVCDSSIDSKMFDSQKMTNPNLFKLKDFSDSWNMNFKDVYTDIRSLDRESDPQGQQLFSVLNKTLEVEYSLNATGSDFYKEDGSMVPAWEMAREFCQKRIFQQIEALRDDTSVKILNITNSVDRCGANKPLEDLYDNLNPLIKNLKSKAYNETLECSASESDGTFSLSYKAILKPDGDPDENYIHKIEKSMEASNNSPTRKINLKGEIVPLVPGNLFEGKGAIIPKQTGKFLVANPELTVSSSNYVFGLKMDIAEKAFTKLCNRELTDLSDYLKENLGITHYWLLEGDSTGCEGEAPYEAYPRATNFGTARDYNAGTISWTAEYDAAADCAGNYSNISVTINRPGRVIANVSIPNGRFANKTWNPFGISHFIQDIGTETRTTMDITISGRDSKFCCRGRDEATLVRQILAQGNNEITYDNYIIGKMPIVAPSPNPNSVLTRETKNVNIYTGEYTANLSFILCTSGCEITRGL